MSTKRRSMLDLVAAIAVGAAAVLSVRRSPPAVESTAASRMEGEDAAPTSLVGEVRHGFKRHRAPRMAAALAYYTIFSLAPLLILILTLVGLIFDDDAARQTLFEQLESAAGADIVETVEGLVEARSGGGGAGVFATVLGFLFLFVGGSGLFLQLRSSLNTIWDIPVEETSGLLNTVRTRVVGFAAVLVLAAALLLFTVGSGLVAFFASEIADAVPRLSGLIQVANPAVAFVGASLVLAVLFRLLPAEPVPWSVAVRGGAVTTILLAVGAALIGLLFAFSDPGASFGEFAAIIVLLVFIYYSAQAFFLGAEITAALHRRNPG